MMATKRVPKKLPIMAYIVAMILGDTPVEFICSDIIGDHDGFLRCGTCAGLTKEQLDKWGVGESAPVIRRKTWINKRQVHSVEELGEYNE
jgi:hypothetical protein